MVQPRKPLSVGGGFRQELVEGRCSYRLQGGSLPWEILVRQLSNRNTKRNWKLLAIPLANMVRFSYYW